MEDVRVCEMTNINVSLYTLGRVIAALSTETSKECSWERKKPHVPYRDSKLTRLLQDSLGGNTRTRIIATLSPTSECLDESISTLRFADRAKQVMAFVQVNERRPVDHALVQRLQAEVEHLRRLLSDITHNRKPGDEITSGSSRSDAITALMEAQLLEYKTQVESLRRENTALRERVTPRCTDHQERQPAGTPDITSLQTSNRVLEETIMEMVMSLRRFFRFEIEEEDLRLNLNKELARASGRCHSGYTLDENDLPAFPLDFSTAPLGFPTVAHQNKIRRAAGRPHVTPPPSVRVGVETEHTETRSVAGSPSAQSSNGIDSSRRKHDQESSRRDGQVSLPQVPGATADTEGRPGKLAYRLRGKHPDEVVVVMKKKFTEDDEERRLRKELKLAKVWAFICTYTRCIYTSIHYGAQSPMRCEHSEQRCCKKSP